MRFLDIQCDRCGLPFKAIESEDDLFVLVTQARWRKACQRAADIAKPWACADLRGSIPRFAAQSHDASDDPEPIGGRGD
jgi:hypothetical protein